MDLSNIEAINNWTRLEAVTEIRSFLGLCGYHWRFIKDFSYIPTSMTRPTRKDIQFVWTNKYEEQFQRLKNLLTNVPMLVVSDGNQDLLVYTDACGLGLGAG